MLGAAPLASAAGENPAGQSAPLRSAQEDSWLLAQIRQFRSYPHLYRAYRLLEQNRLNEAASEMKAYLAINPGDSNVRIGYLNVLYRQNKTEELLAQAEQELAQHPDNMTALLYRGLAGRSKGDFSMALSSLRSVYRSASASTEERAFAASTVADIELAKGNHADALTVLSVLSSLQGGFSTHYRRGVALSAMGKLDDAERAYHLALEHANEPAERMQAQSALGYLAQRKGNDDRAIGFGEAILARDPANIEWLRTLANIHYSRKNYPLAEHMARRALGSSNALQDRIYLANVLYERGNLAAAIDEYAKVANESKDRQLAYQASMGLGYAFQAIGRVRAAHASFDRAAQIKPEHQALAAAASTVAQPERDRDTPADGKDLPGLLADYKKHPGAHGAAAIGYLYAQNKDHAKAASYLERALRMKDHADWRLQLASEYAELGNTQRAAEVLTAYSPRSDLDWHRVGKVHLKIGDKEQAISALSKGARTDEVRMLLSRLYIDTQHPDDALAELQAVIGGKAPADVQVQALRQVGYIQLRKGNDEEAVEAFLAAIDKGDVDPATRKDLGFLYAKAGRHGQALEQFLHVLDSERSVKNMMAVARAYAAMKQPEPALQYYRMAEAESLLLGKDELAALYAESGFVHAEEGRLEEAQRYWIKSAEVSNSPDMQLNLAYAEEIRGMLKEALARLETIDRAPLDRVRLQRLLELYVRLQEKSGNTVEAARGLEQLMAMAPSAQRHYQMALYAIKLGKNDIARVHLEEASGIAPRNNDYLQQLAYVCKDQGDTECAVRRFEQVVSRDPKRVSLYQELGHAYARSGDNEKAIAWFKKAIDSKIDAKTLASSLRSYLEEPERTDTLAHAAGSDDQQIYAMRRQVREMARRYQLNAYQSYRANTREPAGTVAPGFVTGGLVPSQGGIEFLYQPPGIGYRDGRVFRVFGRTLWSNKPESLRIDSHTMQGGLGAEYKPFRDVNAFFGVERLIKIGSQSGNNWLVRASWGYSDGYDMKPNQGSWNQTIVYADVGYFLQHEKIRSVYAEVRQGLTCNVNNTTMVTPHVTLAGRGQRPDPFDTSYLEAGAGISVKYLFNETRHEAPRSSAELIVQYRKPVESRRAGGWMFTAALQF